MAKNTTLAAGTSPFAHLLGGAAALAGRALGRRAEDDAPSAGDQTGEPADPEVEEPAEQPAPPEPQDEGEPEEPEEIKLETEEPTDAKEAKGFRAGRSAERARCEAIFASPSAAGRPDLAATLAFKTNQTSAEAIAVLAAANTDAPKPRGRLDDRMGNRTDPKPGAGGGGKSEASFADQMAAALKKAGR